jgi:hypothetical protein
VVVITANADDLLNAVVIRSQFLVHK